MYVYIYIYIYMKLFTGQLEINNNTLEKLSKTKFYAG